MKLYKLQLVQSIKTNDKQKCKQFDVDMQEKLKKRSSMNVLCSVVVIFNRLFFIHVSITLRLSYPITLVVCFFAFHKINKYKFLKSLADSIVNKSSF